VNLTLEAFLGGIGLLRGHHLDEAEATGLPGVRVTHDVALLDVAILLEQTSDFVLSEAGMNAGHEEVRAGVARVVVLALLTRLWRRTTVTC
jgi:hypothetical protein